MQVLDERILIGSVPVQKIAQEYGTPVYVYDENEIRNNYRRFHLAFSRCYPKFKTYYSVKVNFLPAIVAILHNEGARLDCASIFEMKMAQDLGVDSNDILYTSSYNSNEQLQYIIDHNIPINFDDIGVFKRFVALTRGSRYKNLVSFRLDLGRRDEFGGISLAGSKFGIPVDRVEDAYRLAIQYGFSRFGIHAMTGSNVIVSEHFENLAEQLLACAVGIKNQLGIALEMINIGGGFGIPYRDNESELDIERVAGKVTSMVKKTTRQNGLGDLWLLAEPGRYLVGNAGYLITKVHAVKDGHRKYVGIDAGINIFMRKVLYNAYHRILVNGRVTDPSRDELVNICGQICDNNDVLATDRRMPQVVEGDLLVILDAGAYGTVRASNFCTTPLPAEVLVNGKDHFLIRRRQKYDEIMDFFMVPGHLKN